jgi:hypothetical protein
MVWMTGDQASPSKRSMCARTQRRKVSTTGCNELWSLCQYRNFDAQKDDPLAANLALGATGARQMV